MSAADPLLALGIIVAFAALLGAWASFLRLPLIIAYILAGLILGPILINNSHVETFTLLRDLGLSFLLFLVGLEIKTEELKSFGKQALTIGAVQIIATAILGFFLAIFLGFSSVTSLYIAIALTFSSTVIVVKLLTEKRDLDSLFGKLSVSILLLQDVAAIFVLILLPAIGKEGEFVFGKFFITVVVGLLLVGLVYYLSKKVLPSLFERLARNLELLFLTSLAWLLLISAISGKLGFSIEIGAFLAGLGLASLREEHQIAARIRPLRDFFIVIFFIILGSQLLVDFNITNIIIAVVLSVFVLVLKPLVVLLVVGRLGFRKRTAFMTGITLSQVSEFSLVIIFLGFRQGLISENVVAILTLTAFITIACSSYLLTFSTKIYRRVERYLKFVESKRGKLETNPELALSGHTLLIGCNRLGWEILKQLQKQEKDVLVVDFNPTVVKTLQEMNINYLFGDITDPDIWREASVDKAEIVISTIFDPEDTLELLDNLRQLPNSPVVFVTAAEREWAVKFYHKGADYVIVPRILSGHQVAHLLTKEKLETIREGKLKHEHLDELRVALEKFSLQ